MKALLRLSGRHCRQPCSRTPKLKGLLHSICFMVGSAFLSGQALQSRSHVCSTSTLQYQAATGPTRRAQPLKVESRVTIRFQRYGRKKRPFFRIVAIDSKTRREGRPVEWLGWYNPLSKETSLDAPAIKKWMSLGAKPSEAAARILRRAMVIDPDTAKEF